MRRAFLFLCLLFFGCGRNVSLPKPSDRACVATRDYPGVVEVTLRGGSVGALCSGVIVNPRTVLTASHCTKRPNLLSVRTSFGEFPSPRVFRLGNGTTEDPFDLAALVFDGDIAARERGQVIPLGDSVSLGDELRLVGFGCGEKRTGTNVLYRISNYLEIVVAPFLAISGGRGSHTSALLKGAENRVGTCEGDSGAPALKLFPDGYRVVGIHHAEVEEGREIYSEMIDLTRRENRDFLTRLFSELKL